MLQSDTLGSFKYIMYILCITNMANSYVIFIYIFYVIATRYFLTIMRHGCDFCVFLFFSERDAKL